MTQRTPSPVSGGQFTFIYRLPNLERSDSAYRTDVETSYTNGLALGPGSDTEAAKTRDCLFVVT